MICVLFRFVKFTVSTATTHPRSPLEPELEDVVVPAALNDLVAGVVADVVVLVPLEQVVCRHLVAADQEALIVFEAKIKDML